jgi:hypothetical protein
MMPAITAITMLLRVSFIALPIPLEGRRVDRQRTAGERALQRIFQPTQRVLRIEACPLGIALDCDRLHARLGRLDPIDVAGVELLLHLLAARELREARLLRRPGAHDRLPIGGERSVRFGNDRSLVAQGDLRRCLAARLRRLNRGRVTEHRRSDQVHRQRPYVVSLVPQITGPERDRRILPRDFQLHLRIGRCELQKPLTHVHAVAQRLNARIAVGNCVGQCIQPGEVQLDAAQGFDGHGYRGRQLARRPRGGRLCTCELAFRLVQAQPRRSDFGCGSVTGCQPPLQQCYQRPPRLQVLLQQCHALPRRLEREHLGAHATAHPPRGTTDLQLRGLREILGAFSEGLLPTAAGQRDLHLETETPGTVGVFRPATVVFQPWAHAPGQAVGRGLHPRSGLASARAGHFKVGVVVESKQGELVEAPAPHRPVRLRMPVGKHVPPESGIIGAAVEVRCRRGIGIHGGGLIALQGTGAQQQGQCNTGELPALRPPFWLRRHGARSVSRA